MNRIIALLLTLIMLSALAACSSPAPAASNPAPAVEETAPADDAAGLELPDESDADESADADRDALRDAFKEAVGSITFYKNVRNDSTGRWRVTVIYTGADMVDLAADYYKAYFESDDEIHFICNLGLKTTTKITYVFGELEVDVFEYVDGEEHDANVLPGGSLLTSYFVDPETGAAEAITD